MLDAITTHSVFRGSFFENSNLPIRMISCLMYLWAAKIRMSQVETLISVSHTSAIQWHQYCRDICSNRLLEITNGGYQLGGENCIVEIDESLLVKRKYHRGRRIPEQWMFGMYDRQLKQGIAVYVEDRKVVYEVFFFRTYLSGITF